MFTITTPSAGLRSLARTGFSLKVAVTIVGGVLTFLAAGLDGAPASAKPFDDEAPASKRVGYADLNLRVAEGRATLLHRIDVAARQVCRTDSPAPLMPNRSRSACVRTATANAWAQLGHAVTLAEAGR